VECKGYQPAETIDDTEVERWLKKRVPFLREHALSHPDWKDIEHRFQFWTSGSFSPKAKAMLQKASTTTRKYSVDYKDAEALKEYVKTLQGSPLIKTLNQHFFRHPLVTAEAAANAKTTKPASIQEDASKKEPPGIPGQVTEISPISKDL
jgi:ribosomal protein S18